MKISTTRLETFSDCVIAIILTIMILQLKLPDLDKHDTTTHQIIHYLNKLLPYFVTYTFSFMMISIFWTNHHHMFHLLGNTDEVLLWQNFLFMFLLSLIPFATAIVGTNPFVPIAPAIYGTVMLLTTLCLTLMRSYSIRKKLLHTDTDRSHNLRISRISIRSRTKAIIGTLVYLISIPLAYVNVYFSYACFIIPPIIFFIPEGTDNEQLAEKLVQKNNQNDMQEE